MDGQVNKTQDLHSGGTCFLYKIVTTSFVHDRYPTSTQPVYYDLLSNLLVPPLTQTTSLWKQSASKPKRFHQTQP